MNVKFTVSLGETTITETVDIPYSEVAELNAEEMDDYIYQNYFGTWLGDQIDSYVEVCSED